MTEIVMKPGDSFEWGLKRFQRKVQEAGLLSEARRRRHYESPQARRKRKAEAQLLSPRSRAGVLPLCEEGCRGGNPMKMNGQSRSFAKQVQVDLVALGDADLCNMVQQWIDGSHSSEGALDVPEETRLALGYTRALPGVRPPAHQHADVPGADYDEGPEHWYAPSPQQLRALLIAMDVSAFAQHIIAFAYHSLHPIHPEWYDGVTFNAHLANYLRRMRDEAASHDQRATQR